MALALEDLPDDVAALKAMLLSERAQSDRLRHLLAQLRRAHFGRKSEKGGIDQLNLGLEDIETAVAQEEAKLEKGDANLKAGNARKRRANRGQLPAHLPREEITIEPETKACPCCGGVLHVIGEDTSERLDKVPAKLRVIITRRPKYACRSCEKTGADDVIGVIQAPTPLRLIEGGIPTEALVADVLVSKYADHLPLYRQAQIFAREGVSIDRSTLCHWVGFAAAELEPLHARLLERLKTSTTLFCDETRCPVLDPGRGKTKTGYLWAIARDDRPWGGSDPPAVAYSYAPGRGGQYARALFAGFAGVLQVDGYDGYNALARSDSPAGSMSSGPRPEGRPERAGITLAYCWSHFRRQFYDIAKGGNAPIASEALDRIGALYGIETEIRGSTADARREVRQARARPLVDAMKAWLDGQLAKLPRGSETAKAISYGLNHWEGLGRFLDDGRIEIDTNTVERSIRGLALNRKNALFAGSDEGGANWAIVASLIETCKVNGVNPHAWLSDTLTKLVNRWPASKIDELMPWAYAKIPA